MGTLSPSDVKVAAAIVADPGALIRSSVADIAARAGTAPSTVVRTCQQLGYKGFQDIKFAIARDMEPERGVIATRAQPGDGPTAVLENVIGLSVEGLTGALSTIDPPSFVAAVEALVHTNRVLLVGVGPSGALAQQAAYWLKWVGVHAETSPDFLDQRLAARQLSTGDVCLAVTHSGATAETLASVREASRSGATTIAITSFVRSPVTELADISLVAGGAVPAGVVSRVVHLAVLESLTIAAAVNRGDTQGALRSAENIVSEHQL